MPRFLHNTRIYLSKTAACICSRETQWIQAESSPGVVVVVLHLHPAWLHGAYLRLCLRGTRLPRPKKQAMWEPSGTIWRAICSLGVTRNSAQPNFLVASLASIPKPSLVSKHRTLERMGDLISIKISILNPQPTSEFAVYFQETSIEKPVCMAALASTPVNHIPPAYNIRK